MKAKKSPLKDKPLRQPGQSLQEMIDELIDGKFMNYAVLIVFILVFTLIEWYRWYFNSPPRPILATGIAFFIIIFCFLKILKILKRIKALKLGRDGEKIVGEKLEELRQDGCIVFHDIVGDKFNLDHVILSTKGIYVINTKTWSKPEGNKAKIYYDGTHLNADSIGNKDDVLIQIEAESNWLKEILKESTGREFKTKPVVVFPGWFVESKNHNKHWVLNPKGLPKFIENEKEILSYEDVKLAAYHLSRYVRAL